MTDIRVEFCGEIYHPDRATGFGIGREDDLTIDENPYLHRHFLRLDFVDGWWFLSNVGNQLRATVFDDSGSAQAWLGPGARLPVVFQRTLVLFTAGPTTYELTVFCEVASYEPSRSNEARTGDTTIGPVTLTPTQRQLIVVLAEPLLMREGASMSAIPSSRQAASRLGWELSRFNRKLDNVCDKLDRHGVPGLRGGVGQLATNRRARLVEHAVASRLVTADDLPLLEISFDDDR